MCSQYNGVNWSAAGTHDTPRACPGPSQLQRGAFAAELLAQAHVSRWHSGVGQELSMSKRVNGGTGSGGGIQAATGLPGKKEGGLL
jgi:hypothetical protein